MGVDHGLPLSSVALLDLVGQIYEGPLEPEPWRSFADCLRTVLAARIVAITLHCGEGPILDTYVLASDPGDDTDWSEVERAYRQRMMRDDPHRLELVGPGEVLTIDNRSAPPDVDRFLAANDLGCGLRASFEEPGGMRCWVDVMRRRRPYLEFGAQDVEFLRTLLPHLSRALRLYAGQTRQEVEKRVYEDTIEHFLIGSVLLNGELEVVHANRAAGTIMDAHRGVSISRGRLRLADRQARKALEEALQRALAASDADGPELHGELVRMDSIDGKPLGLLVHPVARSRYCRGAHAPSVVVYLSDLTRKLAALHPERGSSQALVGGLFGLTRQEARLALLLADGCTLAAAAQRIGVAETAVRSYSKRIYAKMGIKGQSDIVRLVHRSLALLR